MTEVVATGVVGCTAGARGVESPVVWSTGACTIGAGVVGATGCVGVAGVGATGVIGLACRFA